MPLLNNMTGKLTKNADKLGTLAGVLSADVGISGVIDEIMQIVQGKGHLPDIGRAIEAYIAKPQVKSTFLLWLVGYGLKEFGYGKYGAPVKKFSEGMLKGLGIAHLLYWTTHADEGCAPRGLENMFNRSVVAPNQGYGY